MAPTHAHIDNLTDEELLAYARNARPDDYLVAELVYRLETQLGITQHLRDELDNNYL